MTTLTGAKTALRCLGIGVGVAGLAYASYAAIAWLRYGHVEDSTAGHEDPLLGRFMARYDVVERHHIRVDAPAPITFASACEVDVQQSPIVRGIFRAREMILGSKPDRELRPVGLLAWTKSLGWGVLFEVPGRQIVMGAVTQPWEADVVFRALPPDEFAAFDEPGYVKIVWTLRADQTGETESIFRTETRALATDAVARAKFRRYWAFLSPGIIVIRWMTLQPVKVEAERRARAWSPQLMAEGL